MREYALQTVIEDLRVFRYKSAVEQDVHLKTNALGKGGKPPVASPRPSGSQPDKRPTASVLPFENIFNMRPPKTNAEKRGHQVSYRLNDLEYLPLKADADRSGESVNELARRRALLVKLELPPHPSFRPDPAVVLRLNGIGVSLRNIEKLCQQSQLLSPDLISKHTQLVDEISAFVEAAVSERMKE
jgi:hypothetical protein